ncbi:MAG: DUF6502 family protein [Steroidobacteraceae bacterium]
MSPSAPDLSSDARKQLLYAVRRVLRPIIKLLIRAGISYGEFADLARGVYVESAIRDSTDRTGAPTRDRTAFLTGLTRQQVDYYIDNKDALPAAAPTLARVITEVLHKWHTDLQYQGPYGIPFELEFAGPGGRNFQTLVAQVDPKARAGLVLEDLLRSGAVIYSGEKHFRTITRWFMLPEALTPHRIEYFGASLTHLAQTLEYNFKFASAEDKRLERFVFADKGLPRAVMRNFEAYARERASRFLGEVDAWLARYGSVHSSPSVPRVDTGVHVFLYVEPAPDPRPLSALVQPSRKVA